MRPLHATCDFKIGVVGQKYFCFVISFYRDDRKNMAKHLQTGKSLRNPLNILKNLGSGSKKLGMVGLPLKTQLFLLLALDIAYCETVHFFVPK